MGKQYFKTIKTEHPNSDTAARWHEERLQNYLLTSFSFTGDEARGLKNPRPLLPYKIEVISQSTAMTVKGHDLVIVTILCCEDEDEKEEQKEY